ncbi:MAG: hypothetical protein MJY62_03110 [Bacteroidales bacterium]|nr:hypothetical protein [Bacteroidales bacterium]
MKKLFSAAAILFAVVVPNVTLAAQDEEDTSVSSATLSIVPFVEGVASQNEDKISIGHGNSMINTVFEGYAGEHFSWLLVNRWMYAPYGLKGLYENTLCPGDINWLNYCCVYLTFGGFNITLGKDMIMTGGFENEPWDWQVPMPFYSQLWNDLATYQWGAALDYTTPSEKTNIAFQWTTSPFGETFFKSNRWTWNLRWKGEYGWFSNVWSASAIQRADGQYDFVATLGQRATFGPCQITLDYQNVAGIQWAEEDEDAVDRFRRGHTVIGSFQYSPAEWCDVALKGLWSTYNWYAGVQANFRPVKNNRDALNLHLTAAYDSLVRGIVVSVGGYYDLNIKLWKK